MKGQLLMVNNQTLLKMGDTSAVTTALLSFFKLIPWPEIAAFLAVIYTGWRLVDMVWEKTVLRNRAARQRRRATDFK